MSTAIVCCVINISAPHELEKLVSKRNLLCVEWDNNSLVLTCAAEVTHSCHVVHKDMITLNYTIKTLQRNPLISDLQQKCFKKYHHWMDQTQSAYNLSHRASLVVLKR